MEAVDNLLMAVMGDHVSYSVCKCNTKRANYFFNFVRIADFELEAIHDSLLDICKE